MRRKLIIYSVIATIIALATFNKAIAQTTDALGAYSPYSLYGVGEISKQGTAYNLGMGGIGIGVSDNRFINYLNPAAVSARDTLAFMLDFGVSQKNTYSSKDGATSAYNVFNMNHIMLTFPIYNKSAFIVGIMPYSNSGYKFEQTETNPDFVADMGDVKYQKYGTGSINQFFFGASTKLTKNLSLGLEGSYYFGSIDRKSNILFTSYQANRDMYSGWNYSVGCFTGKLGIQYAQPLKENTTLTIGATYRLGNTLSGEATRYAMTESSISTDTVYYDVKDGAHLDIASELGVGFSLRKKDKWMFGVDYKTQDWNNTMFSQQNGDFIAQRSHLFNAGFEFIPSKYHSRDYFKRATYRIGAYYEQSYLTINGRSVNNIGLTLGMSLPIHKWYNAISVAMDIGQRGTNNYGLVAERYVNFTISVNLHDVWFKKFQHE